MKNTGKKKKFLNAGISAGLFLLVLFIAAFTGIFDGVKGTLSIVFKLNKEVIFELLVMISFMLFIRNLILLVLGQIYSKRGRVNTLVTLFDSLVRYAVTIIGICWGLSILGVNISTIFASVGIIALIIGFGAESLIADVVTGIFILFENQYNVGDIIEIDGFRGEVSKIGIRTICIRDSGGNEKIINNSFVKNVLNRSEYQSKAVCDIGIPYEADLDEVAVKMERILAVIKEKYAHIFTGSLSYLGVETLADSCVVLRVAGDVSEKDIYSGRRILNKELKTMLEKEGITIPYPQMNVRHE